MKHGSFYFIDRITHYYYYNFQYLNIELLDSNSLLVLALLEIDSIAPFKCYKMSCIVVCMYVCVNKNINK